ncbi:MAG: serine hydrolase, partial [Saprospiraceae bacterium]
FWINHQDPEFPQDAFYADGFEGQYVVIIPSKKMVIVRLGCTQGDGFDITTFVKDVLKTIH